MRILDEAYLDGLFATGGDVEGNTVADRVCDHMVSKIGTFAAATSENMTNAFMDLDDLAQRTPQESRPRIFLAVCKYGTTGP